jgi:hypothetical protein
MFAPGREKGFLDSRFVVGKRYTDFKCRIPFSLLCATLREHQPTDNQAGQKVTVKREKD